MIKELKSLGVMQPYLFPYLGYFSLIHHVDEYIILDDVQMITRGWINRNNILLGKAAHRFTISLINSGQNKNINEVSIGDDFCSFKKTLSSAYSKAPFFGSTISLIEEITGFKDKNLVNFIENSLLKLGRHIGITTTFLRSSAIPEARGLRSQEKILAICQARGASRYINPIGGIKLYSIEEFSMVDLELKFLNYDAKSYRQVSDQFIPNLSIIDSLMFNGPDKTKCLLDSYSLVDGKDIINNVE